MRILLLGEFSGLHTNLKKGLLKLGHEVDVVSTGDGWKKIGEANNNLFSPKKNRYLKFMEDIFLQYKNINEYKDYDVVQLIQPNIFGLSFRKNIKILRKLKKNNHNMFLITAGDHYYIYKISQCLRYNVFQDSEEAKFIYTNRNYVKNNQDVLQIIDGIIPVMYTYAEAYRNHNKVLSTIPLPMNTKKIDFIPQKIKNDKLKIFHGINQEKSKGTKYIREAMEKLQRNYPNDVEIIIDGKMPLNKYLKVLKETNIVVDQALSYEYGMNALYAMAMGKVVLSGNEPESQKEFGRDDIPVINILPSADDIYNKLEEFVLNKESVVEIGKKSRWFVEDFHDHVKVAQQYVDAWNSVEDN